MAKQVVDQWLLNADGSPDPFAQTIDFGMTAQDEVNPDILDEHQGLDPAVISNQPSAPSETPVVVETPPPPPEPEGPEVFEVGDGATVTRTKEKGQWKAVLDPGTGANPEVFWGKNKDELLTNVLRGKLEATKKIRDLNKKVKAVRSTPSVPAPQAPTPSVRQLTADETFEIKSLWESDPAAALDKLVKLRTNVTLEELIAKANRGEQASYNLDSEAVAKEFASRNPDYYSDAENKNFYLLTKWIGEEKLGKVVKPENAETIFNEICATGNFTVQNLEEAFEDLTEDGKLVKPRLPRTPTPVEVQPEPVPAPATPSPRIVSTETRPRAATGIRSSDVTPVPNPAQPAAPTDDDLENQTDEQISALLAGVRKLKAQQARRS